MARSTRSRPIVPGRRRRSRADCDPGYHDVCMSGNGSASPRSGDQWDGRAQREAPTLEELVRFTSQLPEDQAAALLRRVRPASRSVDSGEKIAGVPLRLLPRCAVCGKPFVARDVRQKYCPDHKGGRAAREPSQPVPESMRRIASAAEAPAYTSWADFLERTTPAARMAWCRAKAKKANLPRLMSGSPDAKIMAEDVWRVLDAAQGRCAHCGSLAVEKRPSTAKGAPLPWEQVGRRIGSLGHRIARFNRGKNAPSNLCWSCLWCNTWLDERQWGARDHGAWHPGDAFP